MRTRRCAVEHPFGSIKSWMGATQFLTKGLARVKIEMSMHVLAFNIKRLMLLLGVAGKMKAILAHALLLPCSACSERLPCCLGQYPQKRGTAS